jgi:catechol 2,3-dioxygenase
MTLQKLAHAVLNVQEMEPSFQFHTEVLGLIEMGREGNTVYLGCGSDDNYDVALIQGGVGVADFALQVESEDDLHHYARRLSDIGVKSDLLSDREPGEIKALRFTLPSGHLMELALVKDRPHYFTPAAPRHRRLRGIAPLDVDHITLRAGDKVKEVSEFLQQVLDFQIADVFSPAPGVWGAAWMHVGGYHHDLAVMGGPPTNTLDHLAWTMSGIEHIKQSADALVQVGIPLEAGPGRHALGGNLYAYFWAPGGNRYELSAEMPRAVDRKAPTNFWSDLPKAFSAWGALPPPTFDHGS